MGQMTFKQGSLLFRFTGLKFWEPAQMPAPTLAEASELIGKLIEWSKAKKDAPDTADGLNAGIVAMVQKWFPDWDGSSLHKPFWGKKSKHADKPEGVKPAATEEKKEEDSKPAEDVEDKKAAQRERMKKAREAKAEKAKAKEEKTEDATEEDEAEETEEKTPPPAGSTEAKVIGRIKAGISNLWLCGPAGTGKTTICKIVAQSLGLPCTILSCSAGTSPSEFIGHKFPAPRHSAFSAALGMPGIIVIDEITMLDPAVCATANAVLANNEVETSVGHVIRNPDCTIIATANTTGQGADRMYIGNNQLDAATLDRFVGGMIHVDYSAEYESQFDKAVVDFAKRIRESIAQHNIRRVCSTRAIIAGDKMKKAGLDWKAALLEGWSESEKNLVA